MSWDQRFDDPIILPGRQPLVTLRDAALHHQLETEQQSAQSMAGGGPMAMTLIALKRAVA